MDPATLSALLGVGGSVLSSLFGGLFNSGSTTANSAPPKPKPQFQPMQRTAPARSYGPIDTGASASTLDPNDTRLQAIASLREKLKL